MLLTKHVGGGGVSLQLNLPYVRFEVFTADYEDCCVLRCDIM
jgi:hypothetical protein